LNLTHDLWTATHDLYHRVQMHYGPSPWGVDEPILVPISDPKFLVDPETGNPAFGSYDAGELVVNFARCDSWEDVVGVVVHEYGGHHHQDPERTDVEAYEAEAEAIVARDLHLFLDTVGKAA